MASITALDLIRRSMYLINALAAGEYPDDQDANDGLLTLNEMLSDLSTQTLAVYGTDNDEFVVTPGKFEYTYGLTGDFNVQRPVWVDDAYCIRGGVTTPVDLISIEEYNRIAVKSVSQPLIERAVWINSFPLSKFIMWPIPSEAVTFGISTRRVLTEVASLQTLISLPPGYDKMLRFNLAADLWPEYSNGTTDIQAVRETARKTLGRVKVANIADVASTFDDVPNVDGGGRSWDWRGG